MVGSKYLIVSRHDYRSRRKASVHFIARELAKLGDTRFFSSSFSYLSFLTHDQRLPLWKQSNQIEQFDNVQSYLWRTTVHPCKVTRTLTGIMDKYFRAYAANPPEALRNWIETSDVIFLESGGPEMFFEIIKRINPYCKVIYLSSDTLDVVGTAEYCIKALDRALPLLDGVRLPSKIMAARFHKCSNVYFVPHGFDVAPLRNVTSSPYDGGANLVSVGDMLFDPSFFRVAAPLFPNVKFHIIGGGPDALKLQAPNIKVYPEMPFNSTLPFLEHADAGIAPYDTDRTPDYLADTSMKLMQYSHYGLPAICPEKIAGVGRHRFGYRQNNSESIEMAIRMALGAGRIESKKLLNWAEVTQRILNPTSFTDTRVDLNHL